MARGWYGQPKRHSRASKKGWKTRRDVVKMFHGGDGRNWTNIQKYGLKPSDKSKDEHPMGIVYLAPDKDFSKEYMKAEGRRYPHHTGWMHMTKEEYDKVNPRVKRDPMLLEITLSRADFKQSTDPEVNDYRFKMLKRAKKEKWMEYQWYGKLPPKNIKRLI